ncbi:MAG TPA: acetate/propionate family kinase [Thermodesulfovibrionia bacterium]|nr:acetate/propionate family kinase [Thermodesulfovibrionia bacterium]
MNESELIGFLTNHVELFKDFPMEMFEELIKGSRVVTFERNEAIIEFGEEGRFFGVMLEGEAEASLIDDSGEKRSLATVKSGDFFGEAALMTGDRTLVNLISSTMSKALLIPRELFSRILMSYQPARQRLARSLTRKSKLLVLEQCGREAERNVFRRCVDPYGFKLKTDESFKILVINCGSSSLKYSLFDTSDEHREFRGRITQIGQAEMEHTLQTGQGEIRQKLPGGTHREAFAAMAETLCSKQVQLIKKPEEITAIGHRVVHGGIKFQNPVIITEEVLKEIEKLSELAPLHNPINVTGIREAMRVFPAAKNVAVFDTTFHQTLSPYAYLYGLPYELYENNHIRRYGFHGISHLYVSLKAAEFLKRPFNELEIISCHLGNGASMCAVDHGRSVDTSMGLTPTQGLIMGTRCGDIDPGVMVHLMRELHLGADELDNLINRQSGLKGLSGISNDMREIQKAADEGNHRALLAFKTFCYSVRKYIGAYVAAMQGLDVVIFTGGIGQGSPGVRSLACQGLDCMGIVIDEVKNKQADGVKRITDISAEGSDIRVLVIPTHEELMIARETIRALELCPVSDMIRAQQQLPVPVEVSAHHVHLSAEHVEALFGPGHQLTPETELSQPGQFACKEKVNLIGPKGRVERVRVLGPARKETQVEIAMTEQFKLGIHPPIRESGDLENTPGVTLEGNLEGMTMGKATISKGVICALRHIHMPPEDALRLGLRDKYKVRVRIEGDRELIFGDVLVRVNPNYRLAMHIDTDEGNAANITTGMIGYVEGIQSRSQV